MTPVHVLDRSLISYALGKAQRSAPSESRSGHGRDVLVCIHAEGGTLVGSWTLQRMVRQIDCRAQRDNHARNKQRSCTAANNVSASFASCFHSYISFLRPSHVTVVKVPNRTLPREQPRWCCLYHAQWPCSCLPAGLR